jgi:hypothetical protein
MNFDDIKLGKRYTFITPVAKARLVGMCIVLDRATRLTEDKSVLLKEAVVVLCEGSRYSLLPPDIIEEALEPREAVHAAVAEILYKWGYNIPHPPIPTAKEFLERYRGYAEIVDAITNAVMSGEIAVPK